MDIGEVFRRFFGFPQQGRTPPGWYREEEDDDFSNMGRDDGFPPSYRRDGDGFEEDDVDDQPSFEFFFGGPRRHGGDLGGMFEHFGGGMFQQMESLHRQMEEMMKGFGHIDSPRALGPPSESDEEPRNKSHPFMWIGPSSPIFGHGEKKAKTPRDFMLKDGEDVQPPPREPKIGPVYTPSVDKKKEDTDLDKKLSEDEILSIVKKPQWDVHGDQPPQQQRRQPGFFSSSSSVTFSTIQGAGGKVEKKKTVRNSNGHEETTVTRSLGDQTHTVTTITKEDGQQEKHETFHNMDEKDMGQFENQWGQPSARTRSPVDALLAPPTETVPRINNDDQDIFSRLFGKRWDK